MTRAARPTAPGSQQDQPQTGRAAEGGEHLTALGRGDDREVLSGEGQGQGTGIDFRSQTDSGISGEFPGDDRLHRFIAGVDHRDELVVHPDGDIASGLSQTGSGGIKFALTVLGQGEPHGNGVGIPVAGGLGGDNILFLQQDFAGGTALFIRGDAVPDSQGIAGGEN